MKCPKCGTEQVDNKPFCPSCGNIFPPPPPPDPKPPEDKSISSFMVVMLIIFIILWVTQYYPFPQ